MPHKLPTCSFHARMFMCKEKKRIHNIDTVDFNVWQFIDIYGKKQVNVKWHEANHNLSMTNFQFIKCQSDCHFSFNY